METTNTVIICDNCQSQFSPETIKPDGKWECTYCRCKKYIVVEIGKP